MEPTKQPTEFEEEMKNGEEDMKEDLIVCSKHGLRVANVGGVKFGWGGIDKVMR